MEAKPVSEELFKTQATSWVLENIPSKSVKNISVLPISYADGTYSSVGFMLSRLLELELSAKKTVNVIEREQLHYIQQEVGLVKNGYTQSEIHSVGKLLAVDYFIFGYLSDKGKYLQIQLRIANAVNGKIVAQKQVEVSYELQQLINPLWEDINKIKKSAKQFKVALWTDQHSVKIGNSIKIKFTAEKNCFVTIFSMGTSGRINILFPNRIQPHNMVNKGITYSVPGRYDRFSIKASLPTGVNKIKLFATTKKIPLLLKSDKTAFFREVTDQDAKRFRDLSISLNSSKDNQWAEAEWEVLITK